MKYLTRLYYLVLFTFLIPSINLGFFYSYALGKYLILGMFGVLICFIWRKRLSVIFSKLEAIAISLYFFSLILSIIPVFDMGRYIYRFKDISLVLMIYFIGRYIFKHHIRHRKIFINIVLISIAVNVTFKLLLVFEYEYISNIIAIILHPDYFQTITTNLARQRIYYESYEEIFVPLLFYLSLGKHRFNKLISIIFILAMGSASFLSNFRTRFVMYLLAVITSLLYFSRKNFISIISITGSVMIFLWGISHIAQNYFGYTVIDRLLLSDEVQDVSTLETRQDLFFKGIEIGLSSPVYGIGLDQFDYHVEALYFPYTNQPKNVKHRDLRADDRRPHDIFSYTFAETGSVGIGGLIILFYFFIKQDQALLNRKDKYGKALAIGFWILIFHSLFNPATNFSFLLLFWLLRSQITVLSQNHSTD